MDKEKEIETIVKKIENTINKGESYVIDVDGEVTTADEHQKRYYFLTGWYASMKPRAVAEEYLEWRDRVKR